MPKTDSSLLGMMQQLTVNQHAQNTRRDFGHGTKSMEFIKGMNNRTFSTASNASTDFI